MSSLSGAVWRGRDVTDPHRRLRAGVAAGVAGVACVGLHARGKVGVRCGAGPRVTRTGCLAGDVLHDDGTSRAGALATCQRGPVRDVTAVGGVHCLGHVQCAGLRGSFRGKFQAPFPLGVAFGLLKSSHTAAIETSGITLWRQRARATKTRTRLDGPRRRAAPAARCRSRPAHPRPRHLGGERGRRYRGFRVSHVIIFGWKRACFAISSTRPTWCFVHPGKMPSDFDWMQECTSS